MGVINAHLSGGKRCQEPSHSPYASPPPFDYPSVKTENSQHVMADSDRRWEYE